MSIDSRPDLLPRAVRRKVYLARVLLLWERLWPALLPVASIVALFLSLALIEAFAFLPGWLHIATLAGFAALAGGAIWYGFRDFQFPSWQDARRRLELDSGAAHRPLVAFDDNMAAGGGDRLSESLWQVHRQRALERMANLRNAPPHPGMPVRDPLALRAIPLLALLVTLIGAGGWRPDLLGAAFSPGFGPGVPVTYDLWITPPQYTRLAPIVLGNAPHQLPGGKPMPAPQQPTSLRVPVGSTVTAFVQGASSAPTLVIGKDKIEFTPVDGKKFTATATLSEGERLAIERRGSEIAGWALRIMPDQVPTIEFARDPQGTARNMTRLDYAAADDFGLTKITVDIRRSLKAGENYAPIPGIADKIELELPLAGGSPKLAQDSSYHDLTAHPWAGFDVVANLQASDGAGQTGRSAPARFKLPERSFTNPVAQAVIVLRKMLTKDPHDRAPVAEGLARLNTNPSLYRNDAVVHLALRVAVARLLLDRKDTAVPDVQQLMWDTALRIEEGRLSMAERELRRAQDALQQAIDRGASDEEIEKLMQELKQALDNYMRDLAERMQAEDQEMTDPSDNSRTITSDDLQRMLDKAREMMRSGDRDAARQMLSDLRNMLENMRPQRSERAQRQQRSQQGQQMLQDLDKVIREQHNLLNESERQMREGRDGRNQDRQQQNRQRGQQGKQGKQGQQGDEQARRQQEGVRRQLGDVMGKLGEMMGDVPDGMGRAEQSMRDAERALGQGDFEGAAQAQREALDNLAQGMQDFAQRMRPGPGNTVEQGQLAQEPPNRRDPLGREEGNFGRSVDDKGIKIPDQGEMQRSREILEELRRRAGEADRPKNELDYIERLLKRF